MHYRIPKDTEMTTELLAKYIRKHKSDVANRNAKLQEAYENNYEIFSAPKKEDGKPDVRVATNFAKYIVDTFTGFFVGSPIKTICEDDNVAKFVESIAAYNLEDDHNVELAKSCDIHGSTHELIYFDEDAQICYTNVDPCSSFFLVDDSMLERPMYFIRYYKDSEKTERGSWSDSEYIQYFVNKGTYKWDGEPEAHGFHEVPAVEYVENKEQMGLFESALSMINAYNKALSEKGNDVDYFADAYLKVLGPKVSGEDTAVIKRNRIINFEGDGDGPLDVDFLAKPSADTTQENYLDRLEKLIFLTCMVANISDDNFAGNASGVSLEYKLLAMENLAKFKQLKFTAGLNRRYKVIFSTALSGPARVPADAWVGLQYHFTLNYPANVSAEAETAKQLEGVVSKETQLKVLSIVDDPASEMDRLAEEAQSTREALDSFGV